MELISFGLGANWIAKLYEKLKRNQKKRNKELDNINDIMYGDPLELAKYYVEPNCQEINPADRHEENFLVSSEPVYKKIDEFLRAKYLDLPGNTQMFILSDAGMGKTSLLVMLKLLHLTSFWPKDTDCVLKVMEKETLTDIQSIENKRKTILLLDALDEDPEAYGQVKERLLEVLKATRNFYRVIITCRTQFFPEVEKGPFQRPGLITVGGYVCPAKYLSLFNDEKVELYLKKRFPCKEFYDDNQKKIKKAKELIEQMGSLRCRPMLLSYIDKLMDSPVIRADQGEYKIYNALVDSWLFREEAKSGVPKDELFKVCQILATEISLKGARDISEADLDLLIADISELKHVKAIDIKGRSLLNRNSGGDYRFLHHSIQEFLVTRYLIENPRLNLEKKLPLTNLIAQVLIANSKFKACQKFFDFDRGIFKQLNIRGLDFKEEDLKDTHLKGANLQVADLQGADLKKADFREANLLGADLQGADLEGADFRMADLSWSDLKGAVLYRADLKGAVLNGADLQGAKFHVPSLLEAELHGAVLQGLDFHGAVLQGALLSGTDLRGADFRGAKCRDARFEGADLRWADLKGADFNGANFQGARFEGADLQGAMLNNADLQNADISGAENITSEMLLKTRSLYRVKGLEPPIEAELKKKNPMLFEECPTGIL